MHVARTLRHARKNRGLTQQQLANKAQVSLATVQNLEAGLGNPELSTLVAIMKPLGLELDLRPITIDWDSLSHLGLPLLSMTAKASWRPHSSDLLKALDDLGPHWSQIPLNSREANALGALLWAIQSHYPSVWMKVPRAAHAWLPKALQKSCPLKLRRLALNQLQEYL